MSFTKIMRLGKVSVHQGEASLYVKAKLDEKGELHFTGVVGPLRSGDAQGGCGQIVMEEWAFTCLAAGWTPEMVLRLREIWERWHLNHMNPNCEHQRAWDTRKMLTMCHWSLKSGMYTQIEKLKDLAWKDAIKGIRHVYTREEEVMLTSPISVDLPEGQCPTAASLYDLKKSEQKAAGWVYPSEHPEGLLTKPCDVCGYKYGSAWLKEGVPAEVIAEIQSWPDTDVKPCWV